MNKHKADKKQRSGLLYVEGIRFIRIYRWMFIFLALFFCWLAYNRHEEGKDQSAMVGFAQTGLRPGLGSMFGAFTTAAMESGEDIRPPVGGPMGEGMGLYGEGAPPAVYGELDYATILNKNEKGQLEISDISHYMNFMDYTTAHANAARAAGDYKLYHQLSILGQLIGMRFQVPVYDIARFEEWAKPYMEVALEGLPEIVFRLDTMGMSGAISISPMQRLNLEYQMEMAKTNSDWLSPELGGPIAYLEQIMRDWAVILMIVFALIFTFDTINRDLKDKNIFHSLVGAKSRTGYYLSKLGLNFAKCLLAFMIPLLIGLLVSLLLDGANNMQAPVMVQKGTLTDMEGYTFADLNFARFRYGSLYFGLTETDFLLANPSPELGHAYIHINPESYEFIPYYRYLVAQMGLLLTLTLFYVAVFQWISLEIKEAYTSLIVCMLGAISFVLIGQFIFDQTKQMSLSTGVLNLPISVALGNNVSLLYAVVNGGVLFAVALAFGILRFFRRDL